MLKVLGYVSMLATLAFTSIAVWAGMTGKPQGPSVGAASAWAFALFIVMLIRGRDDY